jgi:hypothetical protein
MIEKSILPLNRLLGGEPAFPLSDSLPHLELPGKGDNPVKMVRHRKDQPPVPIAAPFPIGDGVKDRLPAFRVSQLVCSPALAVDRNEKCFVSWIDPVRNIMRKVFARWFHDDAE